MKKLKKIFGSVYFRFLAVFIGAFMISLLIPAIGANVARAPEIKRDMNTSIYETATKIKQYTDSGEMPLGEAVKLFSGKGFDIRIIGTLKESGIRLNDEDLKILIDENGILARSDSRGMRGGREMPEMFAMFSADGKWVIITPNFRSGPMADFRANQIWFVLVPLVLGTVLIILASITVARPVKEISKASKQVAKGDFSVRLKPCGSGEIRELAENFNSMVGELSSNEYLHKEFVSNVSHEFSTPITSLKGYAKLLKNDDISPEKREEYADIIISESERLSRLSADLLKLSELEYKGRISERKTFSLDEQIRSAIILLQYSWESKNIDLDIDLDEVNFSGDESLLYQVWVNLISNAVRYTDSGGKIRISLADGEAVTFSISDSGRGMTREETENVFRRFYKADKSRSSKGTGLGLAIAKKIAELHGGDITVSSVPSKGTTFTVVLPKNEE